MKCLFESEKKKHEGDVVLSRLLVRVLISELSNGAANHLLNMWQHKQVSTIKYMNYESLRRRHRVVHVHYQLPHGNITAKTKTN